jgi:hypothetical protein
MIFIYKISKIDNFYILNIFYVIYFKIFLLIVRFIISYFYRQFIKNIYKMNNSYKLFLKFLKII